MSGLGLRDLPRPVAVVVRGGGVPRAAHAGVGYALERRGFAPDLITGTSVGALNGATDPATGVPALLDRGGLESALPAGAAVPGVLPPVNREGRTLVDGGVIAHAPVRAVQRAGVASVVVLPTGPEDGPLRPVVPPRRAGAVASRAGLVLLHHRIESGLREAARRIPAVVVPTGIETRPAPRDFGHSQRLIDTAARTAGRLLARPHVSGPGLRRDEDRLPATSVAPGTARPVSVSGARR